MVSMYENLNANCFIENYVPIWHKEQLTLNQASELYNINVNKLREMTNEPDCNFVLFNGKKRLIKRTAFSKYLEDAYSI